MAYGQQEVSLEATEDPAHYVVWTLASGGVAVVSFAIVLYGWTATETSGSASATANIYDGTDHTGTIVLPVNLAQSESVTDWYDRGVCFKNGLFINMGSGQAKGSIFYRRYWQ